MFTTKQEVPKCKQAAAKLQAACDEFVAAMVEDRSIELGSIQETIPQSFGWDGRRLLVQRIAVERGKREYSGGSYNPRAGVETR